MGSSFMDEIFQCLSAKTDGLGLLDTISSTIDSPKSATNKTLSKATPETQAPIKNEESLPSDIQASSSPPSSVDLSKTAPSREVTPFDNSSQITTTNAAFKRFSLDPTNG